MTPPLPPAAGRRRHTCLALLAAATLGLAGCGRQAPVRVGWLNEARGADRQFSEDARSGVLLAIEQRNAAGGLGGRRFELVVQDFVAGRACTALHALAAMGVQAMVGPFSTQLALELLPQAAATGVLMLSPTITSNALVGHDDALMRLNLSNPESALATARMLRGDGHRRIALARDLRNADYAVAWGDAFRAAFEAEGGEVVGVVDFGQGPELSFDTVVQQLLAARPDALVFAASGADAARLAQQVHKRGARVALAAAGWAATPALLELGGQAVEGMQVAQAYNPRDESPRFRAFQQAFQERFDSAPGYGAAVSYDAMLVLAEAMARTRPGETLKQALLQHGPYQGLQQSIAFDRFGDAGRTAYATVVHHGHFELK
ncbi:ABC transporter substrate-binding protein [Pseudorhodoferax sp.]|uniref:ABC transporter substrate-binding protein n=1 Tax=Pseudorhodoferax sp. TaxID=1993553 RepID=UPI002DD6B32D|nr:ABC transporter substrate-binding protein [Pseudorhodoferax sp.]